MDLSPTMFSTSPDGTKQTGASNDDAQTFTGATQNCDSLDHSSAQPARRDCHHDHNWKRRDEARRDQREGSEQKSGAGVGSAGLDQWLPAAKTGLGAGTSGHSAAATNTAPSSLVPERSAETQAVKRHTELLSLSLSSATFRDSADVRSGDKESGVGQPNRCLSSSYHDKTIPEFVDNEGEDSSPIYDDHEDFEKNNEVLINFKEPTDPELAAEPLQRKLDATETGGESPEHFNGKEHSPSEASGDSEEESLRVPDIFRGINLSAPNSNLSLPNSGVSSQFRRLESRRGSSVTFILPVHASSGENSSQASSPQRSICTEEGAQIQERFFSRYSRRRMSAPELPPIVGDRERLRPASRSTNQSSRSYSQLTGNNITTTTTATTSTRPRPHPLSQSSSIPRNNSDSSLKGLTTRSQGPTQSSESVSSYRSGGGGRDRDGGESRGGGGEVGSVGRVGGGGGGAGERSLSAYPYPRSSSRAFSWSAADNNSAGSAHKLETLLEKKSSLPHSSSNNSLTLLPPGIQNNYTGSSGRKSATQRHQDTLPPRSYSVNGIRPSDSPALARLRGRKKGLHSECGAREMETVDTIEHFSRLKSNGMRRAVSDNKLVDYHKRNARNNNNNSSNNNNNANNSNNTHAARVTSSRHHHLSVSRTDKLTQRKTSARPAGVTTSNNHHHNKNGIRRVSSIPAVNVTTTDRRARLHSNRDSGNVDGGGGGDSEDSEEEEERRERIRKWLMGLDCADVPPPEPVIDYEDDPPQTDTALHIVYQDD
ncbi:uncharacterized protein LOC143277023 [Babylonia areolata]|uniref:uncharacterized protein LOC143277023 n=1 Tax=Babylonia areolata TaxID=304850 RepID=UPI003FCF4C11